MHILIIPSEHFITKQQPLSGIFQYHQAKTLAKFGHKVGILSIGYITPRYLFKKYNYIRDESIDNINIKRKYKRLYFPHRYIPFNILRNNYIQMADKLYDDYVKEFGKPDVIHAHNFLYAGLIANYLKDKHIVNYIITEHSTGFARGLVSTKHNKEIDSVYSNASVSTAVSAKFINLLSSRTNSKIQLLSNIVDECFFKLELSNIDKEIFTFFNVASLEDKKNHKILIHSFTKVFKNKNIILKIAGDGPLKKSLKELCVNLNIQNQIHFLGRINQQQVRDEMMQSNCFILPSNYETFGVVLIEALACGLPLIATKCGGPEDIVNKINGLLTDVGNQEQLENAMLFMYDNAKNYNKGLLRKDAKERFGEKAFVANVTKYYKIGLNNVK